MAKRNNAKGKTTIYTTLHRKLKIEQHEPHYKHNTIINVVQGRLSSILDIVIEYNLFLFSVMVHRQIVLVSLVTMKTQSTISKSYLTH